MTLKQKLEVKNTILSFKEPFTVRELYETLREKGLMTEENKSIVMRIVEETFESSLIKTVPFSNKYYITDLIKKTW